MARRSGVDDEETPRGRLLRRGAASLSDAELVSILLHTNKGAAHELLEEIGFHKLVGVDSHTLRGSLTKARTTTLLAAVEFACRLARSKIPEQVLLCRPATIAQYLRLRYEQDGQEVMGALYLDMRNRLVHEAELFRGTLSRAAVEPRAILREGLTCHAARLIIFHSHPSGDPAPSPEDLEFTKRLATACEMVGIGLRDHIILGVNRWVSLRERERGIFETRVVQRMIT